MLRSIRIENFRGFQQHQVLFPDFGLIVGKNNAGKSTVIEAIRFLSYALVKFSGSAYKRAPLWSGAPGVYKGITPSLQDIDVDPQSIFHRYSNPPAKISAEFANGYKQELYIGEHGRIFSVLFDSRGYMIETPSRAADSPIPRIAVLPQIRPVEKTEIILRPQYIKQNEGFAISSAHLRNQLNLYYEKFPEFITRIENSWPGVTLIELAGQGGKHQDNLALQVRNEDFVGEVAMMGHGLQMWLQTMWFLTREKSADTIILDEPDVYMHADLQRQLVRSLRDEFQQVLIATHSAEMLSEVNPANIVIVQKKSSRSRSSLELPEVQTLLEGFGSASNIHAVRIWSSKQVLLVEGKDDKFLKPLFDICFDSSRSSLGTIPTYETGGWSGWQFTKGVAKSLKDAFGNKLIVHCIFDSDFHTLAEIEKRYDDAEKEDISLHIWNRKEIESYLLSPEAIVRLITERRRSGRNPPSVPTVTSQIGRIAKDLEEETLLNIASEIQREKRKVELKDAMNSAKKRFQEKINLVEKVEYLVSGKELISKLSSWAQKEYGVSFSPMTIIQFMKREDIPKELRDILLSIDQVKPFNSKAKKSSNTS